jgi:DNA-binding transcriptional MerR regulator
MSDIKQGQLFKIGAVAKLTGISIHTIRKWEERYGAVEPCRSQGGKRLYSDVDVRRLTLIKKLADRGLSLPAIARSSVDELLLAWEQVAGTGGSRAVDKPARAAVLGAGLAATIKLQAKQLREIEVVASADDDAELHRQIKDVEVDVLLVDCPAIVNASAQRINELLQAFEVPAAVVVYRFGANRYVEALRSWRVAVLRAPAEAVALDQAVAGLRKERPSAPRLGTGVVASNEHSVEPLPPRYSREALAAMALSNPRANCECQKNLVDVVLSLRALEEYLGGCDSRSDEDEALHQALWLKVCEARSNIEDAIEHFAAVEGIALPQQ